MTNHQELLKQLTSGREIAWEKYLKLNIPDQSVYPTEMIQTLKFVFADGYKEGSIFIAALLAKNILDSKFNDLITPENKTNSYPDFPDIYPDSIKNN